MFTGTYTSADLALKDLAGHLLKRGDEVGSRQGDRTVELTHVNLELAEPWRREILVPGRAASLPAQIAETMWILSGSNDIKFLSHYLPRAAEFSDDGATWRGGYGPRLRCWAGLQEKVEGGEKVFGTFIVDQLAHVVDLLRVDPLTRRAVISIYDPAIDVADGKDIPCNNWLHFLSRNGKLDLHVATRSNDLIWGWSGINAFEWSALQEIVAGLLGIQVGTLNFSIGSLHIYDRHWKKADRLRHADLSGINELQDSPRFAPPRGATGEVSDLDRLVARWLRHEKALRTGAWSEAYADEMVSTFPEPMFRSWLRVIAWYWTGRQDYLEPLKGTRLRAAALASPPRPPKDGAETRALAAYDRMTRAGDPFVEYVADLHRQKHEVYGDSWKRRGELIAILANIARKVDRLGVAGAGDTASDTVVDLLVYLVKYRLWLSATGMAGPPVGVDPFSLSIMDQGPDAVHAVLKALPIEHLMSDATEAGAAEVAERIAHAKEEFEKLVDLARDPEARDMDKAVITDSLIATVTPVARRLWEREGGPTPMPEPVAVGHAERNATRAWNPELGA